MVSQSIYYADESPEVDVGVSSCSTFFRRIWAWNAKNKKRMGFVTLWAFHEPSSVEMHDSKNNVDLKLFDDKSYILISNRFLKFFEAF